MDAVYFWTGPAFTLIDYVSLLSTSKNTSFDTINVFFDDRAQLPSPDNAFWKELDHIERVRKQPASALLHEYFAAFVGRPQASIKNRRVLSDIFRYCYLYNHGGTWFDFDTFQVRDVRQLAEEHEFLAGWESPGVAAIGLLSFPPKHFILEKVLERLPKSLFHPSNQSDVRIGPLFFTAVIRRFGLEKAIMPTRYFYPWGTGRDLALTRWSLHPETYSIHLWGEAYRMHFLGKTLDHFKHADSTYIDLVKELFTGL